LSSHNSSPKLLNPSEGLLLLDIGLQRNTLGSGFCAILLLFLQKKGLSTTHKKALFTCVPNGVEEGSRFKWKVNKSLDTQPCGARREIQNCRVNWGKEKKKKEKVTSVCLNITFGGGRAASIQQEFFSLNHC